jgi:hypothetical protein
MHDRSQIRLDIDRMIGKLQDIHSKKLTDAARSFWVSELEKFPLTKISKACHWAAKEKYFPSLGAMLEQLALGDRLDSVQFAEHKPLTPQERQRSDHAAIMAMLWLHYQHGWAATAFLGTVMAQQLGKPPNEVIHAAKQIYTREQVHEWMRSHGQATGAYVPRLTQEQPKDENHGEVAKEW